MEITKNKWINLAIIFAVMILAVVVSVSLLTWKPDPKDTTGKNLKASLNLGMAK